jgi:hypothetical protein
MLREAFEASGLTAGQVARRMDWTYTDKRGYVFGDSSRVRRALGLLPARGGSDTEARLFKTLTIDVAEAIAEAIGVERYEVGL